MTGWGSHGGGNHHKIMRAFKFEGKELLEIDSIFNNQKRLCISIPRVIKKINLSFNELSKTITYDKYKWNNEIGFYELENKKSVLKWNGKNLFNNKLNTNLKSKI